MKIIRNSMFETNSSSTHVLCLNKNIKTDLEKYPNILPTDLHFIWYNSDEELKERLSEIEWEPDYGRFCDLESLILDSWTDKLFYIYLSLEYDDKAKDLFMERYNSFKEFIYSKDLEERDKEHFELLQKVFYLYINDEIEGKYSSVDNKGDSTTAALKIIESQEVFNNFIINEESYISLGGDEYRGYFIKRVGFSYDYDNIDEFIERANEVLGKENSEYMLLNNG